MLSISSWYSFPFPPISANPEEKIKAVLAFFLTASFKTLVTWRDGTAINTKSKSSSISVKFLYDFNPCIVSCFGFTGKIFPEYLWSNI